jgi:hypothetical protein
MAIGWPWWRDKDGRRASDTTFRSRLLVALLTLPVIAVVICAFALFSSAPDALAASSGVAMYGSATQGLVPSDGTAYATGYLAGIDCASAGDCTAVGSYQNGAAAGVDMTALTVNETSGTFATPDALSLPANSLSPNEGDELNDVSCWSQGDCEAVGDYTTSADSDNPLAATGVSGTFGTGTEVELPANAASGTSSSSFQSAQLDGVSCWAAQACTAVGTYQAADGNDVPMVTTMSDGTFAPATELNLPSDAVNNFQVSDLYSISCTGSGDCVAVGDYQNSALDVPLVESETDGNWSASTITLPEGAATSDQDSYLTSVSCDGSASSCTVVGGYTDGSGYSQAMAATETGGSFAQATEISLPSGAASEPFLEGFGINELDGVDCSSAGSCTAVGDYEDSDGNFQTMVTGSTGGQFAPATEVVLPTGAATGEETQSASLDAISCTSATSCLAAGQFSLPAGNSPPMFAEIDPLLSLTTTSLPSGTIGSAYSAGLTASGGTESYTYSVASGTLPAGLSLNAATGAISGTPTAAASGSITFQVADPGPPSQQATTPLTLTVAVATTTTTSTTVATSTTTTPPAATPAALPALPKGVKASAYGTPSNATVTSASAPTLVSETSNGATASVSVPDGSLPVGTVVSIYPMTTHSSLSLPKKETFISSVAVSWEAPTGSAPTADSPITLTITDKTIKTGDTIYLVTAAGSLKTSGSATTNGTVTVTFVDDPVIVVAHAAKAKTSSKSTAAVAGSTVTPASSSSSNAPGAPASTPGTTGSGSLAFTGTSSLLIWLALIGALLVIASSLARYRLRFRINPRTEDAASSRR